MKQAGIMLQLVFIAGPSSPTRKTKTPRDNSILLTREVL